MFPRQSEVLTYLRRLGYTGTVDDCTYNYLRDLTGQTGLALPDLISYYLGTLGYTGSLNDRIAKLEASGVPLFSGVQASFSYKMLALPAYMTALGFTYTRNSPKTVYQNNALVTLAANQFGTTYDSVTGLHAFEAEPAATNLATNSAGAAATWTVSNVTDAGTPITGFAASLAFGDNSVTRTAYKSIVTTDGVTYTNSIFVQMDDGGAPVIGTTSTSGDFSLVLEGDVATANTLVKRIGTTNIYRVSASKAAVAPINNNNGIAKYTTQSARTFRVVGIQVETGSRATSYIATAGATVTRAADVLSDPTANIPGFSASGYTLVVDGRRDVVTGVNGFVAEVGDGSASNRALILLNTTNVVNAQTIVGGASQAAVTGGTYASGRFKAAYSVQANSFKFADNGTGRTEDTAGTMPAVTTLGIGCRAAGSEQLNGYIYGFKLIPVALNQAQTTAQTS